MDATPFHHHPFLSDQFLLFPNTAAAATTTDTTATTTTTAIATATTSFFDDQLNAIEVMSGYSNQASSSIDNKIQSSNSSITMAVHDHHKVEKKNIPTTNLSSSFKEEKTCRRWRKEKRSNNDQENNKKKMRDCKEEGHIGYIHVRARRGEATDRHSLAERVRREKISEKMKVLQAIVPGCEKTTGKAVMLDEVINYVQFLQNEIEVLSSKLASVSPMLHEFGADFEAFMVKPRQNVITNQQQMPSFQEYQMASMVSENNGDIMWGLDEQIRQELDDPFAIINSFDSFY